MLGIGRGDSLSAAQGRNCPLPGGLAAWGMSIWQRKEGGGGSQQCDPKRKQSPERGRNSQVGENTLVRFLSCLSAGQGEGAQCPSVRTIDWPGHPLKSGVCFLVARVPAPWRKPHVPISPQGHPMPWSDKLYCDLDWQSGSMY